MEDDVVGYCEICGEPIYEEYSYYSLPDGSYVCGKDYDCIIEYIDSKYLTSGGI